MSPLQRFQVLLKPEQIDKLRSIEQRTGTSMGSLIRLAVDAWLDTQGDIKKTALRRARTRRRA
jgi:hypothetical protein